LETKYQRGSEEDYHNYRNTAEGNKKEEGGEKGALKGPGHPANRARFLENCSSGKAKSERN